MTTRFSPLYRLLTPLLRFARPVPPRKFLPTISTTTRLFSCTSHFNYAAPVIRHRKKPENRHLSAPRFGHYGPPDGERGGRKRVVAPVRKDRRVTLIRYFLRHPKTPRPLRFSRNRALRHWTIHRAWMLLRRQKAKAAENELMRLHQSMHLACEELRTMDSPGMRGAGALFRLAMAKPIYGHDGVPIEYARAQTETSAPGGKAWNYEWTRPE